jgi:hypothetical protein
MIFDYADLSYMFMLIQVIVAKNNYFSGKTIFVGSSYNPFEFN